MKRNYEQLRISASRRAFTLVEMLVVVSVIAILAALTLFAVNKVSVSSKIAKTRTTVQKIDVAMQQIFETYEDKFLVFKNKVANDDTTKNLDKETQLRIVLHYLRDTMRMEMPQCWAEVSADPAAIKLNGKNYDALDKSPLLKYYQNTKPAGTTPSRSALLFLIIQNLNPEALEAFHGSEIADTDGDGLLEFVDAWGRPIQFLRWAPAFTDSDLQQNVPWGNAEAARRASEQHPFLLEGQGDIIGWFLYPLIYSAGPDGVYGINEGDGKWEPGDEIDPYALPIGKPTGSEHFDNIHNHQRYRGF